jgi:hypothetical protein
MKSCNAVAGSGGRDRTGDLRIMMPGFLVSSQGLASIAAVKPASIHQRVSSNLSNPKLGFLNSDSSIPEDVAPSES